MLAIGIIAVSLALAPAAANDSNQSGRSRKQKIVAEVVSVNPSAHMVTVRIPGTGDTGGMGATGAMGTEGTTGTSGTTGTANTNTANTNTGDTNAADGSNTAYNSGSNTGSDSGSNIGSNNASNNGADNGSMNSAWRLGNEPGTYTLMLQSNSKLDKLSVGDRVEITCRGTSDMTTGMSSGAPDDTSGTTTAATDNPFANCAQVSSLKRLTRTASGS